MILFYFLQKTHCRLVLSLFFIFQWESSLTAQKVFDIARTGTVQQMTKYLKKHPELREILNDFLSSTLLEKPEDVYIYAR